jgi:hypothetical protein
MVIKNTTLLLVLLLALAAAKFRVAQDYATTNVFEQILVLPDNTLAVGFGNVIQILDSTDYKTVK